MVKSGPKSHVCAKGVYIYIYIYIKIGHKVDCLEWQKLQSPEQ